MFGGSMTAPRGLRIAGDQPHLFLRQLRALEQLVASVGPPCWVSGPTDAALLGFDGFRLRPPFHLTVPATRHLHRGVHIIHRATTIPRLDTTTAMGLPSLSATRLLVELARTEPARRLTAAVDSALRDGLTSEDFLHRRLVELRGKGRKGPAELLAVLAGSEVSRGGHSFLERAFLELLDELGLPRPLTQQILGKRRRSLIRVDCHFPGTAVVVELLGYQWHRTPMQMQADAERLNRLQLDGFLAMQFTYVDVVTRSPVMIADLEEALGPSTARSGIVVPATVEPRKGTSRTVEPRLRGQ